MSRGSVHPWHSLHFSLISGGGGGVGNPLDREIESIRWDVLNHYISIERARGVYGVVIDPLTFAVDHQATAKLRTELRQKSGKAL